MKLPQVHSPEELAELVNRVGFLPFFACEIPGLSVEECTPPELYFVEGVDGPWEWKGPVIQLSGGAYGKFFRNKAGFISREWYPDFANYRRDGYDYDARFEDGLMRTQDRQLLDLLTDSGPTISRRLKKEAGYGKGGLKGFESAITRLQMQGYVIDANFERALDREGRPYGWALARYATPEQAFGEYFISRVYQREPEESYQRMLDYLRRLCPEAGEKECRDLLG